MLALHPQVIVNEQGRKTGVILDIAEFEQILALLQQVGDAPVTARPLTDPEDINGLFTDPEPPLIGGPAGRKTELSASLAIIGLGSRVGKPEPPLIEGKPVSEYADLYLYGPREVVSPPKPRRKKVNGHRGKT